MGKEISISVDLKKYDLPTIRYAVYTFTDRFYARIETSKKTVSVCFLPKNGKTENLKKDFFKALEEERFRSRLFDENKKLREYLIKSAMVYQEKAPVSEVAGLSEAEERELDKIIAEVERELKDEKEKEDPLKIKKTWEERYGSKNKRK